MRWAVHLLVAPGLTGCGPLLLHFTAVDAASRTQAVTWEAAAYAEAARAGRPGATAACRER